MADSAQQEALQKLTQVFHNLQKQPSGAGQVASHGTTIPGLYLHGHVGTGKTLVMDIFLAAVLKGLPTIRIHRTHLHVFLRATAICSSVLLVLIDLLNRCVHWGICTESVEESCVNACMN